MVVLKFARREPAEWFCLGTTGAFGDPQPEGDYMQATYDVSDHSERCGMGGRQIKPFRFKSAPKHARSHFLQLYWVHDEFFVVPEVSYPPPRIRTAWTFCPWTSGAVRD